jgi:hypothetical protein
MIIRNNTVFAYFQPTSRIPCCPLVEGRVYPALAGSEAEGLIGKLCHCIDNHIIKLVVADAN